MTEAPKEKKNSGVMNINDLGMLSLPPSSAFVAPLWITADALPNAEKEGIELQISPETQKTGW